MQQTKSRRSTVCSSLAWLLLTRQAA